MIDIEKIKEEKSVKVNNILDKVKEKFEEHGIWFDYEYNKIPNTELCEDCETDEERAECLNSVDLMYVLKYKPTAQWFHQDDYTYACCLTALRGVVMTADIMLNNEEPVMVDYDEAAFNVEEDNNCIVNVVFFVFN